MCDKICTTHCSDSMSTTCIPFYNILQVTQLSWAPVQKYVAITNIMMDIFILVQNYETWITAKLVMQCELWQIVCTCSAITNYSLWSCDRVNKVTNFLKYCTVMDFWGEQTIGHWWWYVCLNMSQKAVRPISDMWPQYGLDDLSGSQNLSPKRMSCWCMIKSWVSITLLLILTLPFESTVKKHCLIRALSSLLSSFSRWARMVFSLGLPSSMIMTGAPTFLFASKQ